MRSSCSSTYVSLCAEVPGLCPSTAAWHPGVATTVLLGDV